MLSIVVPTLNEAARMGPLARHLRAVAPGVEVVVVDGASDDGTADAAREAGLRVVEDEPTRRGRANQMNLGARRTAGDQLLFLHADTTLPAGVEAEVERTLADPTVALGAFMFRLDRRTLPLRLVEAGVRLRNRGPWALPYGDQAFFCRRQVFEALGGYAELPWMEDPELVLRARELGRVVVLEAEAVTSARAWQGRSVTRVTLRNWFTITRFLLGWRPR